MSKKSAKPQASQVNKLTVGARAKPAKSPSAPSKNLDVFDNPAPKRDYHIHIQIPEFTCLCPLTGQPDFAHITIDYIADKHCLELKALKMFMWSFRDEGVFHERVTNEMLDAFVNAIAPRFMRVTAKWYVRGGIYTNVLAEHVKKGWKPQPKVDLGQFEMAQPWA